LTNLIDRFEFYFPTEDDPRIGTGWIRNPFIASKARLTVTLEDKLLDLAADEGLKMVFNTMPSLASFWIHVKAEYPELAEIALKALLPFPSTYLCESGFSSMSIIKTKYRNSMDIRSPLRVALSTIEPRLDKLASSKQVHRSH
jgi:hypothetical protein